MDREIIKNILQENEYGFLPENPKNVYFELLSEDKRFCAGKAILRKYLLKAETFSGIVQFPFTTVSAPNQRRRTIICINFFSEVPNKYLPAEEIIDRGWNIVNVNYQDITCDSRELDDNAKVLGKTGKISMWAWGCMRVLDVLSFFDEFDLKKTGIAGHSRLGKTALLTGAFDERFAFVHSNDSGSGGAGLFSMRNEKSEPISALIDRFSYWFCDKFVQFVDQEKHLPFDQDMLLSLIAPRFLSVASAELDLWANPEAERVCVEKAKLFWNKQGKGDDVQYYLRKGLHYFSREDWNRLLDFLEEKI